MKYIIQKIIIYTLLIIINTSNFKLQLYSSQSQQTKQIPILPQYSCQLSVFGIYNKTYNATIYLLQDYQYFRIYFQSSNKCIVYQVFKNNITQIQLEVKDTNFKQYNQVTQTIYLQLTNNQEYKDNCNNIKQNGEKRSVYLIDKDKQDQYSYFIQLPQESIIITQLIAYIIMLILSHNIKYRKFIPKRFGFLMAFFYSVFLFTVVYVSAFLDNDLNIIYYCSMVVAFVAVTIYLIDIASCFFQKNIFIITSSLVISSLLMILDILIVPNAWFMNDIIAILMTGTCIKFIVIKKIKAAVLPLALLWIFFIVRQFAIQFHIQNLQKILQIKLSALHFQLPTILQDQETGYSCSAFGTSKIIIIGLIVNYAVRIDLYLSTKFYSILISIVSFVSLALQTIFSICLQQIPPMQFMSIVIFLPISIALMLLFASKRGQWAQIWHGSFHDLAIDRKSVRRQSSTLSSQSLTRNLQNLKMNASLISD